MIFKKIAEIYKYALFVIRFSLDKMNCVVIYNFPYTAASHAVYRPSLIIIAFQ